jgi:Rrf2 family protein
VITKTTEAAFRILLYLETHGKGHPVTLQHLSAELGGSPSYLAKVANLLVRSGIIESQRGAQGGLLPAPGTRDVTMLHVVEVCQGMPEAAFCDTKVVKGVKPCSYHKVMSELHEAVLQTLGNRTIGDLVECPHGSDRHGGVLTTCRMCHGGDCSKA